MGRMSAEAPPLAPQAIAEQLERILSSAAFRRAERSSSLLRYIVEQTANGHPDQLKEYTLGSEVLQRGTDFDPRVDPIVRAEASRLRIRIEEYYRTDGRTDPLVITLPKGGYVPQFTRRAGDDAATVGADGAQGRGRASLPWSAVMLGLGLGVGVAGSLLLRSGNGARDGSAAPQFLPIVLTSDGVLASDVGTSVVLSPDGQSIVFASVDSGRRTRLNYRRFDEDVTTPIAGTEGARVPFFSPDGAWIGFWADGAVKKVPVDGGSPIVLYEHSDLLGASWADDGTIIAALEGGKLWRISASPGGRAEVILDLSKQSGLPVWPQVLPGGDLVLYTVHAGPGAAADSSVIEILSIGSRKRKVLHSGGTFGRFLASGYLTYVNQGTLYAVRFDVARLSLQGSAVPVIDGVSYSTTFGYAQFDAARNGTVIYLQSAEGAPSFLEWLDRTGMPSVRITPRPGRYAWLAVSPQERHLAYAVTDSGATHIEIRDLQSEETRRLSTTASDHSGLLWWPTGDRLVLGGSKGMTWIDVTDPKAAGVLTTSQRIQVPWSVTRDGTRLAYSEMNADTMFDLWTVPIIVAEHGLQAGTPERFLATPGFEVFPAFSPDGRWIAYCSGEVYIRRFPDDGTPKTQVSDAGGCVPRWTNGGREIVYRSGRRLMVARVAYDGRSWQVESRQPWTPRPLANTGVLPNFDLAAGDRVAALLPGMSEEPGPNQAMIVSNFPTVIDRRVAAYAR
jgi:eukaryotic-like serine/threonine-protein kinase